MGKEKRQFSDNVMLEGIRSSQNEVITYMYEEFYPMIYKHIITNNGNKADARDIFQDGIIVLYEKSQNPDFKLTATIGTYLFSICKNLWLNKINRQKNREHLQDQVAEQEAEMELLNEEHSETQHLMQELLKKIGESCRNILMKKYYQRLKDKEIAEELNLSGSDYVKTQRYRCLKQLKKLYAEIKKTGNA